jgi:hypothetical protein
MLLFAYQRSVVGGTQAGQSAYVEKLPEVSAKARAEPTRWRAGRFRVNPAGSPFRWRDCRRRPQL